MTHFPALLIIIPLMAAPLAVICRRSWLAWLITFTANTAVIIIALSLWLTVTEGEIIRYELGGWAAPTGIEYYIDTLNASLLLLIAVISLSALWYSITTVKQEIDEARHYLFYAAWALCLTGLLGIVITGDAFNVFVFLEISSLSMYTLIALGRERKRALMAAFRYLIMGSVGASFILLGIGFLYAATGTLNMYDLAERLPAVADSRTVTVAFAFITLGLLIKAAIFPLYAWLPNVYQYAPSSVTVFLAGTATKVSLYVLLRFLFHLFGSDYSFGEMLLHYLLLPLSVAGLLIMSVIAVFQTDIRRMLAYSSIAQIGYMVIAISMATEAGLTAGIIHIMNHALIKAALFMAAGGIIYRLGSANIHQMGNLVSMMPWTTAAFILAALSLIGIPLTAGFVSKWHLLGAAITNGWWPVAASMLISSLLAIVYLGKVIEVMCFNRSDTAAALPTSQVKDAPLTVLIPLWSLVIMSLYTGIDSHLITETAQTAAQQLLKGM